MGWIRKAEKPLVSMLREKQKTMETKEKIHRKTMKAKEKIHRKAIKARKKKVEKNVDRLLVGGCFLVCLTASLIEAKDNEKRLKEKV